MDHQTPTIKAFNELASAYQDKFMDLNLYDDTYDLFCGLIEKPNAHILEIGCGPGNITRYLLSKKTGFQILGIDLAANMVQLAKINNPSAEFRVMDSRKINILAEKYDGIVCGFCIPYLSKEECSSLIKDCYNLLHSGGIFYFSVIEGDYSKSGPEFSSNGSHKMHVYYYQQDFLQDELKKSKFELTSFTRKLYPLPDGNTSSHLIFIARK